jgi:hypothetical protein
MMRRNGELVGGNIKTPCHTERQYGIKQFLEAILCLPLLWLGWRRRHVTTVT